jgi:hypothetical protein
MGIQMTNKGRLLACAWLLYFVHPPLSFGQEVVLGWEGSSSRGYAFASPMISVRQGEQSAWLLRAAVSHLYYDFPEAAGRTEVRSPGQALGVALRYSSGRLTAALGPGYEIRQTKRRFANGTESRTTERGLTLEGNLFFQATPLVNLNALASYSDANDYLWTRAGFKRQISNFDAGGSTTLHAGAEVTSAGNAEARSRGAGGLIELAFPARRASLQFRSGFSRVKAGGGSAESEVYFGIGFYRRF